MNKTFQRKIKTILPYLFVIAAAFAVYAHTLSYELTLLDDYNLIHSSAHNYQSKTVIADAFQTDVLFGNGLTPFYRPVLSLSFAFDNKIAGESVFFAHLINILLHCVACALVLFFFKRYLKLSMPFAFFGALLFALHPANIQTVAWIPGRNDSIYFILLIISFIFFIEYLDKKRFGLFIVSYIFVLLCFFVKESAVCIPFIFVFYYLTIENKGSKKILAGPVILWILGILIFLAARKAAIPSAQISLSMFQGLNIKGSALFLKHIYSIFSFKVYTVSYFPLKMFVAGGISVLVLFFFAFYRNCSSKERERSLFYLLFIFVFLLPDLVGDGLTFHGNRLYVPLFGVLALFMPFCETLSKNENLKKSLYLFLSVLCIFSFYVTAANCGANKNGIAFWQSLIDNDPRERLVYVKFLSISYAEYGYLDDALREALYVAEKTKFNNDEVLTILGFSYLLLKDYDNAKEHYGTVFERNKYKYMHLYAESSILYDEAGMPDKAEEIRNKASEAQKYTPKDFGRIYGNTLRSIETSRKKYAEILPKKTVN